MIAFQLLSTRGTAGRAIDLILSVRCHHLTVATPPDEYGTGPLHVEHPLGHMLKRDFVPGDVDQLVWDRVAGRSGVDSLVCAFADCLVFSSTYIIYLRYHSTGTALTARVAVNSRWSLPCSVTRNG